MGSKTAPYANVAKRSGQGSRDLSPAPCMMPTALPWRAFLTSKSGHRSSGSKKEKSAKLGKAKQRPGHIVCPLTTSSLHARTQLGKLKLIHAGTNRSNWLWQHYRAEDTERENMANKDYKK